MYHIFLAFRSSAFDNLLQFLGRQPRVCSNTQDVSRRISIMTKYYDRPKGERTDRVWISKLIEVEICHLCVLWKDILMVFCLAILELS